MSAPTIDDELAQLRARLAALAAPAVKEKLARLVPGAKTLGVKVPALRELARAFYDEHEGLTLDQAADLLDRLAASGVREEILVGTFVLGRFRKRVEALPWARVERWLDAIDNWETCDQLASNVAGAIVAKAPALVDALVALTRSPNLWRRRFAVATAVTLNQKGRRLAAETLRVCEPLLEDRERMVQKAVGWALREASEVDEALVVALLMKHRARIPARLLTEASEKLAPAHRRRLAEAKVSASIR